jgi:hypothetical protein
MAVIEAIETVYLEADAASVSFTSLGSYEHLQLRGSIKTVHTGGAADFTINLATASGSVDTGNNYSFHDIYGSATSESVASGASARLKWYTAPTTEATNNRTIYGTFVMDILDYRNANKNTTLLGLTGMNDASDWVGFNSGLWANTGAVTTVQIAGSYGDIVRGSSFTLYGLASS